MPQTPIFFSIPASAAIAAESIATDALTADAPAADALATDALATDAPATDALGAPPAPRILGVPYVSQTVTNWCWATCATMLSRFLTGGALRICDAASTLIPLGSCCEGAPPEGTFDRTWNKGGCNRTCTVAEVHGLHGMLGIASTHVAGNVSFAALQAEIADKGRPVEVAYSWTGGGGHVAIVQGVDAGAGTVNIHDPWPDYGQIVAPYNGLVTAYGKGTWFHTWTGIATAGA